MSRASSFPAATSLANEELPPPPSWPATFVVLVGFVLTSATLRGNTPSELAQTAAMGTGLSLSLFGLVEIRRSRQNLLRADLVCMAALYYLLSLEFLFPQPQFDEMARLGEVEPAIQVALGSMAAMADRARQALPFMGRLGWPWRRKQTRRRRRVARFRR